MATKMSLKLREPEKGVYVLHVPSALFGTSKRVRVHGTMNGLRFRAAALLLRAAGEYVIAMSEATRQQLGVVPGETVNVELEIEEALDAAPQGKPAAPARATKPAKRAAKKTKSATTAKKTKPAKKASKPRANKAPAKKAPAKSTKTKTKKKR